jgi:hypothetical protein
MDYHITVKVYNKEPIPVLPDISSTFTGKQSSWESS